MAIKKEILAGIGYFTVLIITGFTALLGFFTIILPQVITIEIGGYIFEGISEFAIGFILLIVGAIIFYKTIKR